MAINRLFLLSVLVSVFVSVGPSRAEEELPPCSSDATGLCASPSSSYRTWSYKELGKCDRTAPTDELGPYIYYGQGGAADTCVKVTNCIRCEYGKSGKTVWVEPTFTGLDVSYRAKCKVLVLDCSTCECENCESDKDWTTAFADGHEKKVSRHCDCSGATNECKVSSTAYRCAAGYFGNPTAGTDGKPTGCEPCPTYNQGNGTDATSKAGATKLQDCYINLQPVVENQPVYYDKKGFFTVDNATTCNYGD